ncbi:MAG: hypothetical protein A3J46_04370 [Candidatus Yanofskybacteria bacterium RIFCSPHIGHO2_02_FULL_41_11]|uniref:Uncharacterized protein n=1 Tax=Candidatus Yanofskybacteria bacterium RIFCSPHIGHO2_02_FULL_41_11 TaxID=1802675 RepID=A0A1F8F6K2_9BACT|nr:MAG: hypothetical protein A3J46_04370 [Candidatus Yanofskybacteria bacterium RIFCSPHIGHO2_02_FULL_41_11]
MTNKDNLIITLILLAGVLAGYIYYGGTSSDIFIDQPTRWKADNLEKLANITLDLEDLDVRLNSLETFGEYPVKPGTGGKINIFAPF